MAREINRINIVLYNLGLVFGFNHASRQILFLHECKPKPIETIMVITTKLIITKRLIEKPNSALFSVKEGITNNQSKVIIASIVTIKNTSGQRYGF